MNPYVVTVLMIIEQMKNNARVGIKKNIIRTKIIQNITFPEETYRNLFHNLKMHRNHISKSK